MGEDHTPVSARSAAVIVNRLGLHARAAAKLAKLAADFDAEVYVTKDGMRVCALSIMGLMMLAASRGCRVEIDAHGPGAHEAVRAVHHLVERGFDEES